MTVYWSNETDIKFEFDAEQLAQTVVEECLDYEGFPYESEVEITLVSDEQIREINKKHRDMDKATDVLSFPMIQYPGAGDFSEIEADDDNFNPDTGEALLGDIIISVERVMLQAQNYGHSLLREYAFLISHSMLHLMGYDHMNEEDERVMFAKQKEILEKLGITR